MPGTVTVACRIPNGVILRLFKIVERPEPVLGGGQRMTPTAEQVGDSVTIKGWNEGEGLKRSKMPLPASAGSYALTTGVSADFWAEWLKANESSDMVKNGLIFASAKAAEVDAQVREHRKTRSGLEPLDPDNLPIKKIETADKKEKAEA